MKFNNIKPFTKSFFTLIICLLIWFFTNAQSNISFKELNFYTQGKTNRTAAEWEPALGTMIVWPLCIPHQLAVELSKDYHLYTLVTDEARKEEAIKWYNEWGIDPTKNTFIYTPQGVDAWWTRDWGPSAVFNPDGTMQLGDGKYIFSTPISHLECSDSIQFIYKDKDGNIIKTEIEDNATTPLASGLGLPVLDLPYINTGGNVATDGVGTAFSTCILLAENKYFNVPEQQFISLNRSLSGFNNYHIISNFEKFGIQHIDCFMKLLDEERMLVAEPPKDHELYPIYENIIEHELKKMKTVYGRPYEILRIKIDRFEKEELAAYTNSIIVNKTIYVPLFQIQADSSALKTWENAMPGYIVKGFDFALQNEPLMSKEMTDHYRSGYGWGSGDALHCRTRAVWDPEMIFMSTKRIPGEVESSNELTVYVSIIDYSKKGLVKGQSLLHWRLLGESDWKSLPLSETGNSQHYYAKIPHNNSGETIEYFLSAASHSGRKETQPRTAPLGCYRFKIK